MTKKSASRLARDKAKKDLIGNSCWDDLNGIYNGCVGLLHSHTSIANYAADRDLHKFLGDPTLTVANLRSLTKDLQQMATELAQIKKQHEGKTGGSDNPDEVMSTFSIYEMYNLFTERHNAVVMPTVYQILEEFGEAEKRREAFRAANAPTDEEKARDPNSTEVIDAVVKERTQVSVDLGENHPDPQGAVAQISNGIASGEIKLH